MGWRPTEFDPDDKDDVEIEKSVNQDGGICEDLIRDDDGTWLGAVMRFYNDGSTYAYGSDNRRLGAFSTDAGAREAVEQYVRKNR